MDCPLTAAIRANLMMPSGWTGQEVAWMLYERIERASEPTPPPLAPVAANRRAQRRRALADMLAEAS